MKVLILRFIDICLLRAGPQDLPASTVLLVLTLIAYCTAGLLLSLVNTSLANAILLVVVDVLMFAGLAYLILWIKLLTVRFVQALTALAGSGAILEFSIWPVVYWQQLSTTTDGPGMLIASLILWLWLFWNIAVVGHILRHTLSTTFFNGALLSLMYMFISISVIRTLFYSSTA